MAEEIFATRFPSPLGALTLLASEESLCGLYFEDHQYPFAEDVKFLEPGDSTFASATTWLSHYFEQGLRKPLPKIELKQGTDFQLRVWQELFRIPEGATTTYAEIAESIGSPKGVRAVGAAVGRNPISIVLPCHRVLGSDGSLTGFAGGIERKRWLLVHEKILQL
ncbi:MAG: methylated-DNA--[protein]-cysteine S-methyltransferase [Verrucomicrobiota bacterium]